MKKNLLLFLLVAFFAAPAVAQINLPADSVSSLLCKKWTVSYALMGSSRIDMKPGVEAMDFEFKKDKSFQASAGARNTKGVWSFDGGSKTVKLVTSGKGAMTVVKLKADELTMKVDTKDATPDDPMELMIVYKVKGE